MKITKNKIHRFIVGEPLKTNTLSLDFHVPILSIWNRKAEKVYFNSPYREETIYSIL